MKLPDISAPHVKAFCASITETAPVLVPVKPLAGLKAGDCFNNLDLVVARHGGEAVTGWALYEWPSVFIEAEYHYTWRRKDGRLEDPTPRLDNFRSVAFLPDSSSGPWVFPDNRRQVLSDDPRIFEYLREMDARQGRGVTMRLIELREILSGKFGEEPL